MRDFRVDIAATFKVKAEDRASYGLSKSSDFDLDVPVFFEVKFNSEMRDLIYELKKQLQFKNFYTDIAGNLAVICVISDNFDDTMVQFMEENNIYMYKINIQDDDINTLTLEEYTTDLIIQKGA